MGEIWRGRAVADESVGMKILSMIALVMCIAGCSEQGLGDNPFIFLGKVVEGSVDVPGDEAPVETLSATSDTRTAPAPHAACKSLPRDVGIW
jgi:hypothetical protein